MRHIYYAVFAVLATMAIAHGQTTYEANLDGLQELPPNSSPGYGYGDFSLNGAVLTVTEGSYSSLLGGAATIRLNDAPAGMTGPLVASLTLDTPGNTDGTFSGQATLTDAQITDLNNDSFYVNITSSVYPGGEIRGQLTAIPEPSTMALSGLGILLVIRWRARRPAIAMPQ